MWQCIPTHAIDLFEPELSIQARASRGSNQKRLRLLFVSIIETSFNE